MHPVHPRVTIVLLLLQRLLLHPPPLSSSFFSSIHLLSPRDNILFQLYAWTQLVLETSLLLWTDVQMQDEVDKTSFSTEVMNSRSKTRPFPRKRILKNIRSFILFTRTQCKAIDKKG